MVVACKNTGYMTIFCTLNKIIYKYRTKLEDYLDE